jgi:hypothetical protein
MARLVKTLSPDVVSLGRGPATTYCLRRHVVGLAREVPIYEILEDGGARELGILHPVHPSGYYVTSNASDFPSGASRDLPFYLFDLRPTGFLGRLIPRQYPDLGFPEDIRVWSGDTTLRYLARRGWSQTGSLILGDEAFQLHLVHVADPLDGVEYSARAAEYSRRASDVLNLGVPGSSAAGEQPKFLATVMPEQRAVLVKFSPLLEDPLAERIADLLVAEHLALATLRDFGQEAARSELLMSGNRVFLEVERFDRTPRGGRRGLISLLALDGHYVGGLGTWTESIEALARLGVAPKEAILTVKWLETFSQLIANSDRHFANLSLLASGTRVTAVAPAYDVSPMLYAPVANQLVERSFEPPHPSPRLRDCYGEVCVAAEDFWRRVAVDERISREFRRIAAENATKVAKLAALAARMPKATSERKN